MTGSKEIMRLSNRVCLIETQNFFRHFLITNREYCWVCQLLSAAATSRGKTVSKLHFDSGTF